VAPPGGRIRPVLNPGIGAGRDRPGEPSSNRKEMSAMQRHLERWLAIALVAGMVAPAFAQRPFEFKLRKSSRLTYDVTHTTSVEETVGQDRSSTASRMTQRVFWDVVEVDGLGEASLEMTIAAMTAETTLPDGSLIRFDSAKPKQADKALAEMIELVDKPLVRFRVDRLGNVKAVKSLVKNDSFGREPPFHITVVEDFPKVGLAWNRAYAVTLSEPLGHGQSYKALQKCSITSLTDERMEVEFTNSVDDPSLKPEDRMPVAQFELTGKVTLDRINGRLLSSATKIDRKIEGFAGKGSVHHFKADSTMKLVERESDPAKAN
jgi:hypothetical protein